MIVLIGKETTRENWLIGIPPKQGEYWKWLSRDMGEYDSISASSNNLYKFNSLRYCLQIFHKKYPRSKRVSLDKCNRDRINTRIGGCDTLMVFKTL